jgi:hypothetical protein
MAHHMTAEMDLSWMSACRNAFLIRPPEEVLASYIVRRGEATLADIGVVQQAEIFDREAQRLGVPPPVIEARSVLEDPRAALNALCSALDVPFADAMLAWPAGRRETDGVWAPAWYDAVERSTSFAPPRPTVSVDDLDPVLQPVAEAARPAYERLAAYRIDLRTTGSSGRLPSA